MSFAAQELSVVQQTYRAFGRSVMVTLPASAPAGPFLAIIDRDVRFIDQQSQAYGVQHQIELMRSDVVPVRGTLVTLGTETFVLEGEVVTSAVEYVSRWAARKQ